MTLDEAEAMTSDVAEAIVAGMTTTDEFPLTCTWCRKRPAAHLAVADWLLKGETKARRNPDMLCTPCARNTTILPGEVVSWWLFDLTLHDYEGEWPS